MQKRKFIKHLLSILSISIFIFIAIGSSDSDSSYLDNKDELMNSNDPYRYHRIFTDCGLIPSPVKLHGGDIMIINTKLFHCGCPSLRMNSNNLLRILSVISMVPRKLLSPSILKVRQLYY